MDLKSVLAVLDLNKNIEEVRIYTPDKFITASLSSGHFLETIGSDKNIGNHIVCRWAVYADDCTAYIEII